MSKGVIGEGVITGIMRGSIPSADAVYKIAKELGVTVERLLGESPLINSNSLLTGQEKSSKLIIAEHTAEYYTSGVSEYVDKLIRIFKEKDTDTINALKHTIDVYLQIPTQKTEKLVASNAAGQDIKTVNAK